MRHPHRFFYSAMSFCLLPLTHSAFGDDLTLQHETIPVTVIRHSDIEWAHRCYAAYQLWGHPDADELKVFLHDAGWYDAELHISFFNRHMGSTTTRSKTKCMYAKPPRCRW